MEGGHLIWRAKSSAGNDTPDFSKSLPAPPPGMTWEQQLDKSWCLKKTVRIEPEGNEEVVENQCIIEHTIIPSDTLQGICLRYRVSPTAVRRINLFSGNSIQFMKSLLIPLEAGVSVCRQQDSHDILLQKFKNCTGEGDLESAMYLEESNWDLKAAHAAWKSDDVWEERQHISKVKRLVKKNDQGGVNCLDSIQSEATGSGSVSGRAAIAPHAIMIPGAKNISFSGSMACEDCESVGLLETNSMS